MFLPWFIHVERQLRLRKQVVERQREHKRRENSPGQAAGQHDADQNAHKIDQQQIFRPQSRSAHENCQHRG